MSKTSSQSQGSIPNSATMPGSSSSTKTDFNTDQVDQIIESIDESQQELIDEEEHWYSDEEAGRRKPRTVSLRCFHCNRSESHFLAYRRRWFYSYLVGLTLGLITIVGPFKCRCCGHNRLFRAEWLNPRKWFAPAPVQNN